MLSLQRTAGNRAVSSLLERAPGLPVQAKLTVSAPGDAQEQEADRVAARAVAMLHATAPAAASPVQQVAPQPMRKPEGGAESSAATLPGGVESSIEGARGGGQPLPEPVRAPMERALGANFGGVRVHTDARSAQLNQTLQARAFTTGRDIFFGQGAFAPGSRGGQDLIAHELAHVAQQGAARGPVRRALLPVVGALVGGALGALGGGVGAAVGAVVGGGAGLLAERALASLDPLSTVQKTALLSRLTLAGHTPASIARLIGRLSALGNDGVQIDALLRAFITLTEPRILALGAGFTATPAVRPVAEWMTLAARVASDADAIVLARIPLWPIGPLDGLAADFVANAHGRPAAEWAALAVTVGPAHQPDVPELAQLAGWQIAAVDQLAARFVANAHGHSAADWRAIASATGVDRHAEAATFAGIAGWNAASLAALAAAWNLAAAGRPEGDWAMLAGQAVANDHASVAAFARIPAWTMAGLVPLLQAFVAAPAGRLAAEWAAIAGSVRADDHAEVATFAGIAGWNAASIAALALAWRTRANGRSAAQWATLAGHAAANDHATVAAFARIGGWTMAGVVPLLQAFVAAPAGRPAGDWAAIADRATPDAHPTVVALAGIAGWNAANVAHLAAAFQTNPQGRAVVDWVLLATSAPVDDQGAVIRFARLAGWQTAAVNHLMVAFQANAHGHPAPYWAGIAQQVAVDAHAEVAAFAAVAGWNAASINAVATAFTAQAHGRPAAEWAQIAGALAVNHHAEVALFAAIPHWAIVDVVALATAFAAGAPGGLTAAQLATLATHVRPHGDHAGTTLLAAVPSITRRYAMLDDLFARPGGTAVAIDGIIRSGPVAAYSAVRLTELVSTHLPDLTLPQLHARINVHGLPGLARPADDLQLLTDDLQRLNQSLQRRNVPARRQDEMRTAFQIRNWRSAQLTDFMKVNAVKDRLQKEEKKNPTRWLYLFALHHQAPAALPPNQLYRAVIVNHAVAGPRTIHLVGWLLNHLYNRHTFHHFAFHDPAVIGRDLSTMFNPPNNDQSLLDEVERVVQNSAVRNGDWTAEIQVGSYKLRLQLHAGAFQVTQFFLDQVPGSPVIPRAVLEAMVNKQLF